MKTRAEERWEHMQQLLAMEAAGHEGPVKISSQRTLFGIKSHVEEVVEKVAAEDAQRCLDALRESEGSNDVYRDAVGDTGAVDNPADSDMPDVVNPA